MTCQCGCGQPTSISSRNHTQSGRVKGMPYRYIRGHQPKPSRGSDVEYVEEDRGYKSPCWVWQLHKSVDGYGRKTSHKKPRSAHRFYYERYVGPIPEGLTLDHLCRVRACVNPSHLEPVPWLVNLRRGSKTRITPSMIDSIVEMKNTGMLYRDIAIIFGISRSHTGKLVKLRRESEVKG